MEVSCGNCRVHRNRLSISDVNRTTASGAGSYSIGGLLIAAALSAPLWTVIATWEQPGGLLGVMLFVLLTSATLFLLVSRRTLPALALLAYLAALQPAFRQYVPDLP